MNAAIAILRLLTLTALINHSASLEIGEVVCAEGIIMDGYCLYDNGNPSELLDEGIETLRFADQHTFHCLLDVNVCLRSDFHVLNDPVGGSNRFTVAFRVDDDGKDMLIDEGRAVGREGRYPACDTCTGDSNGPLRGFRAGVVGTVTELGDGTDENPPVLAVSTVQGSNGIPDVCQTLMVDTDTPTVSPTNGPTSSPTKAPTSMPTATPIKAPTALPTIFPTMTPTALPTATPIEAPTASPTIFPTMTPTALPTATPIEAPMASPTVPPTMTPTAVPTGSPTQAPEASSTVTPTIMPTASAPDSPTMETNTGTPTNGDTPIPTMAPSLAEQQATSPGPTRSPQTVTGTDLPTSGSNCILSGCHFVKTSLLSAVLLFLG